MKQLYWIWHNNEWRLAFKSGGNRLQPVRIDQSESEVFESAVVMGPEAVRLYPSPAGKPTFKESE